MMTWWWNRQRRDVLKPVRNRRRLLVEWLESRRLLALTINEFPISSASSSPFEITAGPDGNLWFTDGQTHSIGMINPTTHAITEFPIDTADSSPTGITAGPDGDLWFTDSGNASIGMIDPTTHAINEFPIGSADTTPYTSLPNDITTGSDGNLWFTDLGTDEIGMINPTTHAIAEFSIAANRPYGITAGPDGNLWITDTGEGSIGMFNPTTHAFSEFSLPTTSTDTSPTKITTGPDGNLWFTAILNGSGSIGMFNPTTDAFSEFPLPDTESALEGITTGLDGNLWFTDLGTDSIGMISPTTDAIAEFPVPTANSFPYSITAGPDGNLWFTESDAGQIGQVVLNSSQTAARTTTALTASANPATAGQTVTFTASVTSTAGTPSGSVNFLDGATVLNPAPVALDDTGSATFSTVSLAEGPHTITAVFVGNSSFQTSSSAALSLMVNAAATNITLTASANPATVGQQITFTANVTSTGGTPTGSVNFLDGTTVLNPAPVPVDGMGTATFSTSSLAEGPDAITAVFVGNSSFQTSSSAALSLTVNVATTTSTPPRATGIGGVGHSKKGTTSITIAFNEALDLGSAHNIALYSVLGAVKKRGKTVYTKHVAIKSASYDSNLSVTIKLAKPYKGALEVTVRAGLKAENSASSSSPQSLIAG